METINISRLLRENRKPGVGDSPSTWLEVALLEALAKDSGTSEVTHNEDEDALVNIEFKVGGKKVPFLNFLTRLHKHHVETVADEARKEFASTYSRALERLHAVSDLFMERMGISAQDLEE